MPGDFTPSEETNRPESENEMFAPTPIWERRAKTRRRGMRARRDPADSPTTGAASEVRAADASNEAAESEGFRYDAIRTEPRRSSAPKFAIAAGVAAIAIVGAIGWYMNRSSDAGVPELTPGAPGVGEVALAAPPVSPLPLPGAPTTDTTGVAAGSASSADVNTQSAPRTSQNRQATARVRPAPVTNAQEAGVDASADAPIIEPPSPSRGGAGPTLNMPPEQIAPSLDPALPSNAGVHAAPPAAPVAGDATTP